MKTSTKLGLVTGLVMVFISLPMAMFVTYSLLKGTVDRLVWFCFWANVPVMFFIAIIGEMAKGIANEED